MRWEQVKENMYRGFAGIEHLFTLKRKCNIPVGYNGPRYDLYVHLPISEKERRHRYDFYTPEDARKFAETLLCGFIKNLYAEKQ